MTDFEVLTDDEAEAPAALQENQLYDYITNQPVKDSPQERTLQAIARSLTEEYGFDHTQLRRDVPISFTGYNPHGEPKKVRRVVQIAVFPEDADRDDAATIERVCIIQAPNVKGDDPKRGTALLEEVLAGLPVCDYGLWTNGMQLSFLWKHTLKGGLEPVFEEIYDLPGYGETVKDLDKPEHYVGRIATGENLQRTFARVHDYIYGNQGLKKDAAFFQVLNLIFCKIHDERSGKRRFWVKGTERNTPEGQAAIARRVKELFDAVKRDPAYASVFSERDAIELNDRVLAFAVGEISRYTLLDTDVDVKGAAYEEITSNMLKQQRGQFFTPTNVIRLMIDMLDPGGNTDLTDEKNWPRIMDPACGSGRFLTYALDHMRRKAAAQLFPATHKLLQLEALDNSHQWKDLIPRFARACLYGIDFDPDLKRAARMNMILNNDGHGNILSFNSLEFPIMLGDKSLGELKQTYADASARDDIPDPARARLDANLGTFDYVFTNPPFGAKIPIDDPRILKQYDLGHRWSKGDDGVWRMGYDLQARVAPEILFVERCVQWVKPGTGRAAIVLPDGILGNPDAAYIRQWILTHCQALASVDLPVEAFLPQVGVQASLLFLRRKSQEEIDAEALGGPQAYDVFMAIAETVGHDRRGNELFVRDEDGAERFFMESKPVLQKRGNRKRVVTQTAQGKKRDDDLPKIGKAYRQWLQTGRPG